MSFFGGTTLSETPLKCVSMNNQECKVRSEITNINSNEFFPFSIKTSKCSGSSKISMVHTQKYLFPILLKT